jgi:hypothetical protein
MDYRRQAGLINPQEFKDKSIAIIGAGATGSHVALSLAQLGLGDSSSGHGTMTVYDFDHVEAHNLANQVYAEKHIGMPKVEALKQVIAEKCGFNINTQEVKVENQRIDATYVFILTDTMASRKEIYEKCLRFSFNIDMIIETRMGLKDGRVYAFKPSDTEQADAWKATLYDDDEAAVSPCGASASIATTVQYLSSLAASNVVQHFNQNYARQTPESINRDTKYWNEIHFSLYPLSIYAKEFSTGENQMLQFGL